MLRFFRCFLCFLVIFCLLINLYPLKAEATSAGIVATFASAGAVTVSAPVVIAAGLIALGIMVGTNDDFQRLVNDGVLALGNLVNDGAIEVLRCVDALGQVTYYVSCEVLETLRGWLFNSSIVNYCPSIYEPGTFISANTPIPFNGSTATFSVDGYVANFCCVDGANIYIGSVFGSVGYKGFSYVHAGNHNSTSNYYCFSSKTVDAVPDVSSLGGYVYLEGSKNSKVSSLAVSMIEGRPITYIDSLTTNLDLTLGYVPIVPVDGSSARQWSEEYTDRGLYVVKGSGGSSTPPEGDSGDEGDDNNGKWYWPLVLGTAAFGAGSGIGALTQQDQWTGDTPEDFNDYTTGTEYEIVGSPEVEFGTGIELVVPDPAPDTGGDSGDNPGAGIDPDDDPDAGAGGSNDYSSWLSKILVLLEKIWNSILEIPTKFATWFDNIISEIQELPSKFATWFDNIISAIQELPSKFADWFGNLASKLENIWEAICNIPEAIGNVLRSIFVPSEDFLTEKVQNLRSRFNWIEPILGYGDFIKAQLVNPEPPVLYVHLGNAEGSYNYGGTVKFLDLTWYERYKSQGDAIISGFLWALFAWRMYVKLPGIINGVAGDVGHISYGESAWQKAEGRKDRKEKGGKNK